MNGKEVNEKFWNYFELSEYKYPGAQVSLSSKEAVSEISRALIYLGITLDPEVFNYAHTRYVSHLSRLFYRHIYECRAPSALSNVSSPMVKRTKLLIFDSILFTSRHSSLQHFNVCIIHRSRWRRPLWLPCLHLSHVLEFIVDW